MSKVNKVKIITASDNYDLEILINEFFKKQFDESCRKGEPDCIIISVQYGVEQYPLSENYFCCIHYK